MAKGKNVEMIKMNTPVCKGKFLYLNNPLEDADGQYPATYAATLVADPDEANELVDAINKLVDETYEKALVAKKDGKPVLKPAQKKTLVKKYPYEEEYIEDEETGEESPTGNLLIKCKQKAEVTRKKDGKTFHIRPRAFDRFGRQIDLDETMIFGGSTVQCNVTLIPWFIPATPAVGVKLQLNATQVIELSTGGGSDNAEDYGFQTEAMPEGMATGEDTGEAPQEDDVDF